MLGVFPASGGLGGSIVSHLLRLLPADQRSQFAFISRHPDRLKEAQAQGAVGVEVLCLISYASIQNDHRFNSHKRAIEAAGRQGVKHIVYTSLGFAGRAESKESVTQVMAAHLRTEKYLREVQAQDSSFGYTIVREGIYSESTPIYTAFFTLSDPSAQIKIPHDGSGLGVAWVKRDELGEATALVLKSLFFRRADGYKNRLLLFTGEKEWTLQETVELLGSVTGRTDLRIEEVSVDEYAEQVKGTLVYGGQDYAKKWATAWEGIRRGETAVVTPTLREILGREPEPFELAKDAQAQK
ncbi:hypothetical protein JCM10296v2_002581 [Rhodotorula toruloides]